MGKENKETKEKDQKEASEKSEHKQSDYKQSEQKQEQKTDQKSLTAQQVPDPLANLPKEAQEKLKAIKSKLEKFQKNLLDKFDKYIMGIALLPPQKEQSTDKVEKDKINVVILIDDSDSKKMSKFELKDKLGAIIAQMGQEIDKNLVTQTIIVSELWQSCYDSKYDFLQTVALAVPIFDTGMLAAVKIAEVHKSMVLKKFEKYIVSYVLAGSLVQGKATSSSDIDVWIVIDDTDVKKMTRAELKDKLRAIIIGMGIEAGEITGIRNKLNIQVYILTDFWDSLKEANPIIFTLLRDGVPFYDRGVFMPWKQLLKMGKIKPSREAIDMFMGSGDQMLRRVKDKLKDMGMEDIYYALLTPSQAAIMMFGIAPPAPKETPEVMRDIFVKKEKLLEEKFVEILEHTIKVRKDIEHGEKKELTGKELDELLTDAEKFLKRINRLFTQIEKIKEEESMLHTYETIVTLVRDVLRLEGIEKVSEKEMVEIFEKQLVLVGKIPDKYLRILVTVVKAKKDYDDKKLTKQEVEQAHKDSNEFIRFILEYTQRKRGRELERAKLRVKHGSKFGEILLLDGTAYIIRDIDNETKEISKAPINEDGGLGKPEPATMEELEHAISKVDIPPKVFIKEPLFENLREIFGKDVEVQVNY
ncbi:nucleotidyltransferase domain-containing protein [Candidatus Woesearchaeota archaeon]|nr:nucleotidyltransferase domain-containing protein [Candidatus Woesearchaeota archaeon]